MRRKLFDEKFKKIWQIRYIREKKYECPLKMKPTAMIDKKVQRRTGLKDRNTLLVGVPLRSQKRFLRGSV